jgi:ACT domain-containing protein
MIMRRPQYRFSDKKKELFLDAIAKGHTISSACQQVKISRQAFYEHCAFNEEFDKAAAQALESQIQIVEEALYSSALKGNVTAQIYYLGNRAPHRWQSVNKVDVSTSINFAREEIAKKLSELTTEELKKIAGVADASLEK